MTIEDMREPAPGETLVPINCPGCSGRHTVRSSLCREEVWTYCPKCQRWGENISRGLKTVDEHWLWLKDERKKNLEMRKLRRTDS